MHLSPLPAALLLILSAFLESTQAVSTITVTSKPTATPVPSTDSSYTNAATFKADMIAAHNFYRSEHNASALVWNDTSARFGSAWAGKCVFKHTGGPTGENLAAGYANATASVDGWGTERESYDWSKPGFGEKTGHFTQLVWRNTTSVGCGVAACNGKDGTPGYYVVCEYYPAGNIVGSEGKEKNGYFIDNVKKQIKGKITDTVETGVSSAASALGNSHLRRGYSVASLVIVGVVLL